VSASGMVSGHLSVMSVLGDAGAMMPATPSGLL
jgi:hypothetical protein